MKYKHLFFDLDQTVAPSRTPMLEEMFDLLSALSEDVIIVTGQGAKVSKWQTNNLPAYYLSQCGNYAEDIEGNLLWENLLTEDQKTAVLNHIAEIRSFNNAEENPDWTPLEDRGALICYSPIGNNAPVEIKRRYDPDSKKREQILLEKPFEHDTVCVRIGGSTSFDYTHKEHDKGTNVARLIKEMNWSKADSVYFGDRLHKGGNDEPVLGVIDTIPVKDHLHTYGILKEWLD